MKFNSNIADLGLLLGGVAISTLLLSREPHVHTALKPDPSITPTDPVIDGSETEVRYVRVHAGAVLVEDRKGRLWTLDASAMLLPPEEFKAWFKTPRSRLSPAPPVFPEQLAPPKPFRLLERPVTLA
jgi:hypothetical protein